MIGGLRRRLSRQVEDPWSTEHEFGPEFRSDSELLGGPAVLLATQKLAGTGVTNDVGMKEHYKAIVGTAIERGGWYQGQAMSVAWLRMILAGLESRPFPPEDIWEGERTDVGGMLLGDLPSYKDLFHTERSQVSKYG